jgi:hypothetical protein
MTGESSARAIQQPHTGETIPDGFAIAAGVTMPQGAAITICQAE